MEGNGGNVVFGRVVKVGTVGTVRNGVEGRGVWPWQMLVVKAIEAIL